MEQNKGARIENNEIDLTSIETTDHDQLASAIETFYKKDSSIKTKLSYNWDRNHRMLDGDQWLVFDGNADSGGSWKKLQVSKSNDYIPRPVTNYLFDVYQTLKGYLIKNKPRSSVSPNTQLYRDKQAAKIASLILEANWERLSETDNYEYAASVALTYGTVFKKDYWDLSTLSMAKVPKMVVQPKIDPMSGQVIGQDEVQETDPVTGDPLFEYIPLGDVATSIVEPQRLSLDPLATGMHNTRWIMEVSIQPLSWVVETYSKEDEGYTNRAQELTEEPTLAGSLKRYYDLKNSSGIRGNNLSQGDANSTTAPPNTVVLKELYERPSQKNPKGRLIVVANGICLYAGESRHSGNEVGDWHPYSEFRWETLPGRFWGKSPFDAACEVQKQINSIDATIQLTRKTMAVPQKLIATGSGVTPSQWTGRPGQVVEYRPTGGSKPEIIPGVGVDVSVFEERKIKVDDLKTLTGAMDILKGDRPSGVNAASALQLLFEVGTGKLYPALDRWKRFIECSQKKQLKLVGKYYKEPREDFVRLLKMKNREIPEEAINRFIGSDLYDNCNVTIEAGSNIPKLDAAKKSMLTEAAQYGSIDMSLPANRMEFNRQMGISGFDNDVGPDTKRAEWENDLLENIKLSPDNRPIVLVVDNHELHIEVLKRRIKEPSFMELDPEVQQAFFQHLQEHETMHNQELMQQQMNGAAMQQPGAPSQPTPAGSGAPEKTMNAINNADMPPASMKP